MGLFVYQGTRQDGRSARGVVEADSPRGARVRLRQQGIYPTRVREEQPGEATRRRWWPGQRVGLSDLAVLSRQFATLVGSGMAVVPALAALEEQSDKPGLRGVIAAVRSQVNEGRSLSAALADYPGVFPDLYRHLVAAGEASGSLARVLTRLADLIEQRRLLRSRILVALIYPAFMLLVGGAIVFVLLSYVVPRVIRVFLESGQSLPWPTQVLWDTSQFLAHYGIVAGGVAALALWAGQHYSRGGRPRLARDRWLLRLPLIGGLVKRLLSARFARTMSLLLASGIPAVSALRMTAEVLGNRAAAQGVLVAADELSQGSSLAAALREQAVLPPLLLHVIQAGETSGALESMLERSAVGYEADVEAALSALTSLLEPLMIVLMGLLVGFIVLAMLWPIFEMNQLIHL